MEEIDSVTSLGGESYKMSFADIPNLWVPLALLGLIIAAAVFFSRN